METHENDAYDEDNEQTSNKQQQATTVTSAKTHQIPYSEPSTSTGIFVAAGNLNLETET